jgi:hypothetical protein
MQRALFLVFMVSVWIPQVAGSQLVRTVGFKGGIAATSQTWEYANNISSLDAQTRFRLDLGVFVEWLSQPAFSITTEAHYIQKGFKVSIPVTSAASPDGDGSFLTFYQDLNYFSFFILAKGRIELGSMSLYGIAGPRLDLLYVAHNTGFGLITEHFRPNEWGITLGVGIEAFCMGPFRVGSELRYSPTLQASYSSNLLEVRNRSIEMLLVLQAK